MAIEMSNKLKNIITGILYVTAYIFLERVISS
jgi:hypothetical protein